MTKPSVSWTITLVIAVLTAALGFIGGYAYCAAETEKLAIVEAVSNVKLHANLLRQMERGDVEGARAAHQRLLVLAGATLDALAPAGSTYNDASDVLEAKRLAREFGATERD